MGLHTLTGRNPLNGRPLEVCLRDGVIQEIREGRRDEDAWLSPGLVDLQVNGYGGDDVNLDTPDADVVLSLTKKMVAAGVTTYLPTVITASELKMVAALRGIAEARRYSKLVADTVPYVHVEGPSISGAAGPRGAHPLEHVRPPSLDEFDRWQQASGGLVGMVTLSPHFIGVEDYIRELTKRGVHVALGHTDASAFEISRAVDAGARLSTHLGNGVASVLPRHPNLLWTQLADDRLTATLIADGHHLPVDTFKAMVRAKGVGRSILVSDSVALAGMPGGIYDAPVGGRVELHADGRLSLLGTEYLAGAVVPLKDGVARAICMMGFPVEDSIAMATENPGRFAGGVGVLRVGMPADLIRFTIDREGMALRIHTVVVQGKEWQ
jgi:N-acetylglucosamine-6-phosphate deacetylase